MKSRVLFVCVVTPFRFGGGAQATTAYLDATLDVFGHQNVDVLVEGMNGVSGNLEGNESLDFDEKIFATDVAGFSFGFPK